MSRVSSRVRRPSGAPPPEQRGDAAAPLTRGGIAGASAGPRATPVQDDQGEEFVTFREGAVVQTAHAAAGESWDTQVAGTPAPGGEDEASTDAPPCSVWALGLPADAVGPVEWWPPKRLKPYAPRHVILPTFRGSPSWAILQQLVKESGVREPLLVLADGQVVDGVHRLELAKILGLPDVPVRVLTVAKALREEDRIQLETTLAVLAVGRRHIAPSRVQGLLLGLTQAELGAGVLNRGLGNLRRGRTPAPGPEGPTLRALAASTGVSYAPSGAWCGSAARGRRISGARWRRAT